MTKKSKMEFEWVKIHEDGSLNAITAARRKGLPGDKLWSVMIELNEPTSINAVLEKLPAEAQEALLFPEVYEAENAYQFLSVHAPLALIEDLNTTGVSPHIANVHLGLESSEHRLENVEDLPPIEVSEDTVIVGVIDDGVGIAHELFRTEWNKSRVEYCAILPYDPIDGGKAPSLGRILRKSEIDGYLNDLTWSGLLDEDLFYKATGQVDLRDGYFSPVSLRKSHGTHVLGLTAGFSQEEKVENRPIICTVMPPRVVHDTSGISLIPSLALSLELLRVEALRYQCNGKPVPFVLNFSYGNFAGPHDGTSEVSRLIENFIHYDLDHPTKQKRWVTLPSGNGNLAQAHAVLKFPKPEPAPIVLDLRVLPDDRTDSHVEMWMPYSDVETPPDFVSVTVTPPFGQKSPPVSAVYGEHYELRNTNDQVIATLRYTFNKEVPTKRGVITLAIEPTASHDPDIPLAPSGRWEITTTPKDIKDGEEVEVWIRRDETLPGYRPGGRQSYFDNACYQPFDSYGGLSPVDPPNDSCPVRRAGMISGFADGPSPIVVAAYTNKYKDKDGEQVARLSNYSAAGPLTQTPMTPEPARNGPDVSAKGDDSIVRRGVFSAGSRCGTYVRMSGTSMAAPAVARMAADGIKAWDKTAREWAVKAVEDYPVELDPKPGPTRTGAGALNAQVDFHKKP
ncbi:S8 family serine peptidase [Loktanella agnita]|uniref:S8 family serine peptidase n=1 Tax=Loktanella agnita TaxID=287097 RepID=UPI003988C9A9